MEFRTLEVLHTMKMHHDKFDRDLMEQRNIQLMSMKMHVHRLFLILNQMEYLNHEVVHISSKSNGPIISINFGILTDLMFRIQKTKTSKLSFSVKFFPIMNLLSYN